MTERGVGERRLNENRRRFRRLVVTGVWLGGGVGVAAGIVTGYTRAANRAGDAGIEWLAWPVMIGAVVLMTWYTLHYFRRIDELDLLDNLWASTAGLYAVVMTYPGWVMLHDIGQAGPPRAGVLWWTALGAALIAYCWRKISRRFL